MNSKVFYKIMAKFYDLLDVVYFRNYDRSPRKVVNDRIKENDKILDLCTGTATNAINIASHFPGTKVRTFPQTTKFFIKYFIIWGIF